MARHAAASGPSTIGTVGATSKRASDLPPPAALKPASRLGVNTLMRSGEKNTGRSPSAISAARATFRGPIAAR